MTFLIGFTQSFHSSALHKKGGVGSKGSALDL